MHRRHTTAHEKLSLSPIFRGIIKMKLTERLPGQGFAGNLFSCAGEASRLALRVSCEIPKRGLELFENTVKHEIEKGAFLVPLEGIYDDLASAEVR
jgi:hypothetical protein